MKKLFLSLVVCTFIVVPTLKEAHATDMAKIVCSDYNTSTSSNKSMMLIWFDGYLSGSSDNTVLNEKWMMALGTHVTTYCAANASATMMSSLDSLPEVEVDGGTDMLEIPCSEVTSNTEDATNAIFWIDGYLSAKADNTIMDDAWIEKLGLHLGKYCGTNPKKTMDDAIDALED